MQSILEYDKETLAQHLKELLQVLSPGKSLFNCYMLGGVSLVVKEIVVLAWRQGIPRTDERLTLVTQYLTLYDAHIRVDEIYWERSNAQNTYGGKAKYLESKKNAAGVLGVPLVDDCPAFSFRS